MSNIVAVTGGEIHLELISEDADNAPLAPACGSDAVGGPFVFTSLNVNCPACYAGTMAKNDVNQREGDLAIRHIGDNIERVSMLRREGNAEGAAELAKETAELVTSLSGKGSIATKKTQRDALREAEATPIPVSGDVVLAGESYTEIFGVSELVDTASAAVREGVKLGTKLSDVGLSIADTMLSIRLKINNPKTGLPDLKGTAKVTQAAARGVYRPVMDGYTEDDVRSKDALRGLQKVTSNRMQDALVTFLQGITADVAADVFPMLKLTPGENPSEAVYRLYSTAGVELPRKGYMELQREAARALRARAAEDDNDDPADNIETKLTKRLEITRKSFAGIVAAAQKNPESRDNVRREIQGLILDLTKEAARLSDTE